LRSYAVNSDVSIGSECAIFKVIDVSGENREWASIIAGAPTSSSSLSNRLDRPKEPRSPHPKKMLSDWGLPWQSEDEQEACAAGSFNCKNENEPQEEPAAWCEPFCFQDSMGEGYTPSEILHLGF